MDLVRISEFARLSRLSPRAPRLYDESGLPRPARVDPGSGYRWYSTVRVEWCQPAPAALAQALVARRRRAAA